MTPEDVTFREVLATLKSVSEHLDFTTERPSNFGENWVPTLEFKVGQDYQKERYTHNYYEKPMNTRWVLPKISSMDEDTKRQILANDLVRKLSSQTAGSGSSGCKLLQQKTDLQWLWHG